MKVRRTGSEAKVEMQMTPMIDVVFQLLTFFIMSFKVASPEGNFNIKMPLGGGVATDTSMTLPLKLTMRSNAEGVLTSMTLDEKQFMGGGTSETQAFKNLHQHMLTLAGNRGGPGAANDLEEVELDCDPQLRYFYAIRAITEVSGHKDANGRTIPLYQKVKFSPPKKQAG